MSTQTIQQTSKMWKAMMLVAVAVIVWGMFDWGSAYASARGPMSDEPTPEQMKPYVNAVLKMFGGFVLATVSRVGAWWFHG